MRAFTLRFVCLIILALAWSVPAAHAQDDGGEVPRFESADCPMEVPESDSNGEPVTVECGYLTVLEHHDEPEGDTIRLAIAILPSLSPNPEPDPVIYLEGGPGGSALEGIQNWLTSPLRDDRDFILLEQRGTYYSEPNLYCTENDEASSEYMDDLLTDEQWLEIGLETSQKCIDRLTGEGVDLSAYNSIESAADIADLRTALGYDEINLYGISYGTYLAQYVMEYQPEGVRSVILDSTVPVAANSYEDQPSSFQRAFDALFAACADDAECNAAFPELKTEFNDFVKRANEDPFYIRIRNPYNDQMVRTPVRGDDVLSIAFQGLYDYTLIPIMPLMLHRAANGDYRLLATFYELFLKAWADSKFSVGMQLAFDCQDEMSDNDLDAALEEAANYPDMYQDDDLTSLFQSCALWGEMPPEPLQDAAITSDIPTLVMAGSFDPITPPQGGQDVAEALPNGQFVEFPALSHGTTIEPCAGSIAAAFVDNPDGALPVGCMQSIPDPMWITGITPLRHNNALLESLLVDFDPLHVGLLGGLSLLALAGVFVWPIVRIVHRLMKKPETPGPSLWVQLAALLGWGISVWNLLFVVLFTVAIFTTALDPANQIVAVFGLPEWAIPIMLMPWLSVLALIPLVVLNVPIWRSTFWGWFGRVFYLLLVAVAIGFVAWMLYWGLIGWPF